jgi:signal transduction histidine kinase
MVMALAVLLGAAVAVIPIDPPLPGQSAPARAAVETLTVLVAALAACLLCGRARASSHGRDSALAGGVALFAVVEADCSLLPAIATHEPGGALLAAAAIGHAVAVALLAVAVLAPSRLLNRTGRNGGGELDAWIAAAVVLLGGAQLAAAAGPVVAPDHLATADLLRSAAAIALLAGALRQLGTYPSAIMRRAVAQERRRIAQDLHDGLAQELAYIAANAPRMATRSGDPVAAGLAEAAAFALDQSRLVIAALAQEPGEPLGPALAHAAERIATRAGRVVRADLQAGVDVEPAVRGDLLRIVMEATTNAVRHSGASEVSLSLTGGETVVVRIADDGVGFTPEEVAPRSHSGLGLKGMQERAERAGGQLRVRSRPGDGTVVEVRIA